jgi:hypothetical protein
MRNSLRLASLVLVAGAAAACNQSQTGRNGKVSFTPSDCGAPLVCTFSDRLAVGGVVGVDLSGSKASINASGLHLASSAPWIFDVQGTSPSGHARLIGLSEGSAQLLALDATGRTVDYIDVAVAQIDDLSIDVYGEGVQGPDAVEGADAGYRIAAGSSVNVKVTPRSTGLNVMGDVQYDVQLSEGLARSTTWTSDPSSGEIDFNAEPGVEELYVAAPGGAWKRVVLFIN